MVGKSLTVSLLAYFGVLSAPESWICTSQLRRCHYGNELPASSYRKNGITVMTVGCCPLSGADGHPECASAKAGVTGVTVILKGSRGRGEVDKCCRSLNVVRSQCSFMLMMMINDVNKYLSEMNEWMNVCTISDMVNNAVYSLCVCCQPISSTWYDYWGADYGTYGYNPYIGIPVAKPPVAVEKPGSQSLSVSVSQGKKSLDVAENSAHPCLYIWPLTPVSGSTGRPVRSWPGAAGRADAQNDGDSTSRFHSPGAHINLIHR